MSLPEIITFDKEGQAEPKASAWPGRALFQKLFLSLVIILVAALAFGVGRLTSGGGSEPIKIEYDPSLSSLVPEDRGKTSGQSQAAIAVQALPSGSVIASKNGTKYHYLHCPGAKQIKEANKVTFSSSKEAEASGYTLAANCLPR